mgnify:FL=1
MADKNADKGLRNNNQTAWWQPALVVFVKLSGWIGLPIIIALFLGKWLDKKYNSAPWLLLACIGLAFILSMAGLIKETVSEYKKIDRLSKDEKINKNKF